MEIIVSRISENDWKLARKLARKTVGKDGLNKPVSDSLKRSLVRSEHSPIREVRFLIDMYNIPTWVAQHFSRHRIATISGDFMHENVNPTDIEHFVTTQRVDRTGSERGSQDTPVDYSFTTNVAGLIAMSKVRLCRQASKETRKIWLDVVKKLEEIDKIVATALVPTCIYRGFCPENSCGYDISQSFLKDVHLYRMELCKK